MKNLKIEDKTGQDKSREDNKFKYKCYMADTIFCQNQTFKGKREIIKERKITTNIVEDKIERTCTECSMTGHNN